MFDEVEIELRRDVRWLAYEIVRLDHWAEQAHERGNYIRMAELHIQRELARERRSALMRELWEGQHAYAAV
jgi:hypothetical protein